MSRTGNFIRDIDGSFYIIVLKNDVTITWWSKDSYYEPMSITPGNCTTIQVANKTASHVRDVVL